MLKLEAQGEYVKSTAPESHGLIATNNIYKLVLAQSACHERGRECSFDCFVLFRRICAIEIWIITLF